jgi:hypothetical protein
VAEHAGRLDELATKLRCAEVLRDQADATAASKVMEAAAVASDAQKAQHVADLRADALRREARTASLALERKETDMQVLATALGRAERALREKSAELQISTQKNLDMVARLTTEAAAARRDEQASADAVEASHITRITELQRAVDAEVEARRLAQADSAALARDLREARDVHSMTHTQLLRDKADLEQTVARACRRIAELEYSEQHLAEAALEATGMTESFRMDAAKLSHFLVHQTV